MVISRTYAPVAYPEKKWKLKKSSHTRAPVV